MSQPQIRIVEQPAEKSFRFRYESENRGSGSLVGAQSTSDQISYPKIQIQNFIGTVVILISCVTNEKNPPYRQHPHKLSSRKNCKDGIYSMRVKVDSSTIIEFKDIGIIFVKRENIKQSLEERKEGKIDPTNGGFDHMHAQQKIDLHCVRLCFQIFSLSEVDGKVKYYDLGFIISNPIMDKKSHGSLKKIEVCPNKSSILGGERVIMLTDRVKREDIEIIFYGEDDDKNVIWKKVINGNNSPQLKVHHQYAISFVTPNLSNCKGVDVVEPQNSFIQLRRPSDQEFSDPVPFEFTPCEMTGKLTRIKRQKKQTDVAETKLVPVPIIQENNAIGTNMIPKTEPNVNPPPLIDLSYNNDKENRPVLNAMQQYRDPNNCQAVPRSGDMTYYHAGDTSRANDNNYYYQSQYGQHQNMDNYFDELINTQHPRHMYIMPNQSTYQHHQPPLQQQYAQHQQSPNLHPNNSINNFDTYRKNLPADVQHLQPLQPIQQPQPSTHCASSTNTPIYQTYYDGSQNKQTVQFVNTLPCTTNETNHVLDLPSDLIGPSTNEIIMQSILSNEIDELSDRLSSAI